MPIERNFPGIAMERPRNAAEVQLVFNVLRAVVNGLGRIIGPDVEVVLHDLRQPATSVIAIANGHISKRTIGSPVFSGPFGDEGLRALIEAGEEGDAVTAVSDYKTTLPDGRELDSLSLMFRGPDGKAVAGLCVNADRGRMRALRDLLSGFLDSPVLEATEPPAESVEEVASRIIEESIASVSANPARPSREERMRAVQVMQDRGLFLIRQSADLAAERLGVTRYTIYNYLDLKTKR